MKGFFPANPTTPLESLWTRSVDLFRWVRSSPRKILLCHDADLGEWREGRLHVLGRADDVVQSGGVSVPLATVESLLHEHPDVAEVAAVGVDDPVWGTRVVALAVPRPDVVPPPVADVRAFVHARAEPACVPADVVWVDALPRPAPGKVDRAAVRRRILDERLTSGHSRP